MQILYLIEIADFSHGIEFIFYGCHWSIQFTNYIPAVSLEKTDFQSERKRVDYGLKLKVYIVYIWIKLSGFKVFLSKVPSLGVIQ